MRYGLIRILSKSSILNVIEKSNQISKETNRSILYLFIDVLWCAVRYGAGPCDYELMEFYLKDSKQRKTFITRGINNSFVRKYNDKSYFDYIDNKAKFYSIFSMYLKRKWYNTKSLTIENLENLFESNSILIYKPSNGLCGMGVEIISKNNNIERIYNEIKNKEEGVIEEYINQHIELQKIYPKSLNTIRVVTFLNNGKCEIIAAFLRIGRANNYVDNLNHGGISAKININTGIIDYPAADKKGNYYINHPDTDTPIIKFKVPKFNDILNLCKEASTIVPEVRYIGWDVAVCDNDIKIVEANAYPGHDILQLKAYTPNGIGMKDDFNSLF